MESAVAKYMTRKSLLGKMRNGVASHSQKTKEAVQMDNQSLSHTKWKCQYHIVFIPKYRRKKMYGKVQSDVREILQTLCEYKHVRITAGAVMKDHVHLCSEMPPKYSISSFMGYLKGKSALQLFDRHPEFKARGDKEFWARG